MQLYRIGPPQGPHQVGIAAKAEAVLKTMQDDGAASLTIRVWSLEVGWAMLALRLVTVRGRTSRPVKPWFYGSEQDVESLIEDCIADSSRETIAACEPPDRERHAAVMRHLRTEVFQTTQATMARIAGKDQSMIHRWEKGHNTPGLDELLRIRAYAQSVGIPWQDSFLLDPPAQSPRT